MPAVASSLTRVGLDRLAPVDEGALEWVIIPEVVADLREHISAVPDPRDRRGVRHSITTVLAIAACAVAAGARSFVAVGEWAADASQQVLAVLGARRDPRRGCFQAPTEATVRRVLGGVDADAVDAAVAAWLAVHCPADSAGPRPCAVAVDGKTLRGTCGPDGSGGVHLVAAMTHQHGAVLSQADAAGKTSEISRFKPVLDQVDLTGRVVTADALHTARAHARYVLEARNADYVFTVKENQHRLYAYLDALPWHLASIHTTVDIDHGRHERRTIQVLPLDKNVKFP